MLELLCDFGVLYVAQAIELSTDATEALGSNYLAQNFLNLKPFVTALSATWSWHHQNFNLPS